MSYNGGVSYKGDKALAQEAMPEVLKLANMVAGLKASAGLDRLEKVYDLEGGGTVRIVDYEYNRHVYIDVTAPTEEAEEVEEDVETLESSTYAVFPTFYDTWSDVEAPSTNAAAISTATKDGNTGFLIADKGLLTSAYNYSSAFTDRLRWSVLTWEGPNGIDLYCRFSTATNRYSMSWGDRGDNAIYFRGNTVCTTSTTIYSHFLGMGIMGTKLITLECQKTDFTAEAVPIYAGGTVTVKSRSVSYDRTTQTLTAGAPTTVGTFSQSRTDYGLTEDAGWSNTLYQRNQAGLWYDFAYDPEQSYNPQFGSLWFNFSPDGTKAVRCRYFPETPDEGDTVYNKTWKEEIVFSLDEAGDVQMVRTKTANAAAATYTTVTTGSSYDNGTDDENASVYDSGTTSIITQSISGGNLPIAYDYDEANELVTLEIVFNTASFTSTGTTTQAGTITYTRSYPDGTEPYPVEIQNSGTITTNSSFSMSQSMTSSLRYVSTLGATVIPWFSNSGNATSSGTVANTDDRRYRKFDALSDTVLISGGITGTGSSSSNYSGSDDYYQLRVVVGGIHDMNLRHGWIVRTNLPSTYSNSGSGTSSGYPDGASIPTTTGAGSFSATRTDVLQLVRGGLTTITLPKTTNTTPPIKYSVSETHSAGRFPKGGTSIEAICQFSLLAGCVGYASYKSADIYPGVNNPEKSSSWAAGMLRGLGGGLAVDKVSDIERVYKKGMFSIQSCDFSWERGGDLADFDAFVDLSESWPKDIAQLSDFPLCQQAMYYYDTATGAVSEMRDVLWGAEAFILNPPFFRDDDSGIGVFHFAALGDQCYGLISHIEYADTEADL